MSTIKGSAKVWWIVIILIIIVGGIWWWSSSQSASTASVTTTTTTTTTADNSPAPTTGPAGVTPVEGLSTSPSDDSDAALNQDLNSVGTQLNGLSSDNAAVDAGLNATSSQ
jgi:cytoskeletal protein RodZ